METEAGCDPHVETEGVVIRGQPITIRVCVTHLKGWNQSVTQSRGLESGYDPPRGLKSGCDPDSSTIVHSGRWGLRLCP